MKKQTKAVKKQPGSGAPDPDAKGHAARCAIFPGVSAAVVIEAFAKQSVGEQDVTALTDELMRANMRVGDGDMSGAESMLMSQAYALQSIFVTMARRSALNAGEYINASDTYMRMALRAQNQCRMTLETLSTIKNPPVVFAKQANISHGHQQVNNGDKAISAHAHAAETEITPNEKGAISHDPGETLDTGTTRGPSRAHQDREAVGARHRAKDQGG